MLFKTLGDKKNPVVLFFHAMGVTGESSEPVARYLQPGVSQDKRSGLHTYTSHIG